MIRDVDGIITKIKKRTFHPTQEKKIVKENQPIDEEKLRCI